MHKQEAPFLKIFHFDMNHVSLQEDYIRKWLRRLSDIGYNAILWELEDKVRWETCAQAVWPEAMSKSQFRGILEYSLELGFLAIPLLQTVGHGEYIMKHPTYAHMREQSDRYDCYCTSNCEVRIFLKELIVEYLDLFGEIDYFHLGGDEAYAFATCPECKAAANETSRNHIYAEHIMDIAQPVLMRNIKPGIWSDMILHYPENVECVPKELIIWDWNYWDGITEPKTVHLRQASAFVNKEQLDVEVLKTMPEIMDGDGRVNRFYTVDVLKRLGYDVVLCSSTRSWGDSFFCGKHDVHFANVVGAARKAFDSDLLGHCVTSWAIRIFNFETQYEWLSMACMDEVVNSEVAFQEIVKKCGQDILGVDPDDFYQAINKIASDIPFVTSGENQGAVIQWTGLKDSVPAPEGYIKNVLSKWKNELGGKIYDEKKSISEQSVRQIKQGKIELEKIATKISEPCKCEFVNQWLNSADFQLRMAEKVQGIFKIFETDSNLSDLKTIEELLCFQKDCYSWMLKWMTPLSAKLNSELIFEPIREFFNSYATKD